jgi:uncharacterized protein YggE
MNESWPQVLKEATKPVRYAATAALIFLALFLAAKSVDAFGNLGHATIYPSKTITVEGSGSAVATSSIASVSFTVSETATTVADAQGQATTKTNAALDAIKNLGVEDRDVKTTSYNVSPQYTYPQPCYSGSCPTTAPKITGYTVSQSVTVKVRDIAKAGDVLQALGTAEVQNISGPDFATEDDAAVKAEARANAVADAKTKAQALAKDLGVHLGKVVSYYENGPAYPMAGYGGDMKAMSAAVPAPTLPTGENETNISVSVTYEIN